jgi:lysophospholipase L1-like esterase
LREKKIILIGDSITEAFPVNELLSDFNIFNKGIYGDNTNGVYNRLTIDVINEYPEYVFILIGTNDFALEKTDAQIVDTIHLILDKLCTTLVISEIYLTSILPTRNISNRPNDRINSINKSLNIMSQNFGIHYFDLAGFFKDEKGELQYDLTTDGLHISDKGYKLWAEVLKNKLLSKPTLC